jgi:CO dehydrogenase/acetyl-CoA synthase beta subunit
MPKKDELPQELTDRIARQENAEDTAVMDKYIIDPIKAAGKKLYENVVGTEEQNRKGQEALDKQAKEGSKIAKFLGGKAMKSGGMTSSASKRADGCAVKGKTKGRII